VDKDVLYDFALSTVSMVYGDIRYGKYYIKAINVLLNNPIFDPTFKDNKLLTTALRYYYHHEWAYDRVSKRTKTHVFHNKMVACIWSHPAVRASYVAPTKSEFEVDVNVGVNFAPIMVRRSIKDELSHAWRDEVVTQCKSIKGELMERTWHPDRVWNWCFDEDEKREIGTD
jgi:hypothetical protein